MKRRSCLKISTAIIALCLLAAVLLLPVATPALPPVKEVVVVIENFGFHPDTVTSRPGTRVIWINRDQAPHRIALGNLVSPILNQGDKWAKVFGPKGKYPYHCWIHPSMTGEIIIE